MSKQIKGHEVVVNWGKANKATGKYDWSAIDDNWAVTVAKWVDWGKARRSRFTPQPWSALCDHATPDGIDILKADADNVHWEAQP